MELGSTGTNVARLTASTINIRRRAFRQKTKACTQSTSTFQEVVTLNAEQRESVQQAIDETCQFRHWLLRAINVRTNHVHVVVSIGEVKPGRALNAFKAYATRKMRENGCWQSERSPWADKGSKRNLWNERSIELAVDYVLNGQGDDLPDFD